MRCEVCDHPMSHRSRRPDEPVCYRCRQAGAAFARAWMVDLRSQGMTVRAVAELIGSTISTVASRLGEIRRGITP